jgi:hypothetical protein
MSTDTSDIFSIENYTHKNHEFFWPYKQFFDVEELDSGSVNKVYKANWDGEVYVALRSFNSDNITVTKEIIREVYN